ncbi:LicD family protein [Aliarcobacter cryaerophilus]|uniref:LicD family protein n=1 Tax=Aliarcobacter cryaerophilus TaxID=28198 RepID=UPI0011DF15C4|nr:LicD family protein [Aliarcobacter cryaerophilus]
MKNKIETKKGDFFYTPIKLYYGRKIIDINTCRENLLLFKQIMDNKNIPFCLMFGTLLGAVREKNFIKYDEDVDVFLFDELKENILETLFEFMQYGFQVARYSDSLLSLIRNNDYIDIYFFKETSSNRRCMNYIYPSYYFNELIEYDFLDTKFNISKNYNKLLEEIYGKDWKIPKQNTHAEENYKTYQNYEFSINFNKFYNQIQNLNNNIIIYGNGTIGKTIQALIPDKIIRYVDINDENNHPKNLKNMKYDKIIISVLGREEVIIKYLVEELGINRNKIVTLELGNE